MVKKRGQAAMEFMMTYGWAILVVLIAVASLAYFGVLSPARFLPSSCTLFPGLACTDVRVTENTVVLRITNGLGQTLVIDRMDIFGDDGSTCGFTPTTGSNNVVLPDGSRDEFDWGICNNGVVGGRFSGDVEIDYRIGGLSHTRTGSIITEIEDPGLVDCTGACVATPVFAHEEDGNPFWNDLQLLSRDNDYIESVDEGIERPDYIIMAFPNLGITSNPTSAQLTVNYQTDVTGCSLGFPSVSWRRNLTCYDGTAWRYIADYTEQPAPPGPGFLDQSYDILAACASDSTKANHIIIKMTFDPANDICGHLDIDFAEVTVTAP